MKQGTIVHEQKCIGCGQCVKDCVACCIKLENGKAKIEDKYCIGCGHCYAICPVEAVELQGWGDGGGSPVTEPVNPDGAPSLSGSSVREYWVFATQIGQEPKPSASICSICFFAAGRMFTPSPP